MASIKTRQLRRERVRSSKTFKLVGWLSKVMDDYFLDPLLGMFFPVVGDTVSTVAHLPALYVSMVHVRSIPLTLAVIFNMLVDALLGCIPFLGEALDFFQKSYKQNYRLIQSFVEGDEATIRYVNRRAWWMGIGIVALCVLIYFAVRFLFWLYTWAWDAVMRLIA